MVKVCGIRFISLYCFCGAKIRIFLHIEHKTFIIKLFFCTFALENEAIGEHTHNGYRTGSVDILRRWHRSGQMCLLGEGVAAAA